MGPKDMPRPGRKGRQALPDDERAEQVTIRLHKRHREALRRKGMVRLRAWLDEA